jgi:midasin
VCSLLGLLRLHLLLPPAGADPAAKYSLVRQHTLGMLRCQVEPELAVRRQYSCLPGGPNESARIADLEARCAELEQHAERLERRNTPRPVPPQYLAVRCRACSPAASDLTILCCAATSSASTSCHS